MPISNDITYASLAIVLKGIIGYLDYSLAVMIFECFKSNGIFVFLFKASHFSGLFLCYIMDV